MKQHDQFAEMLARRAELTPEEDARLTEHLTHCSQCRHTAEAYNRQTTLLRSLPEVVPPPALRATVLTGIATPAASRARWVFPLPFFAPLVAVAAALLIVGVALLHHANGGLHTAIAPVASPTAGEIVRQPTAPPVPHTGGSIKRHRPTPHGGATSVQSGAGPRATNAPAPTYSSGGNVALGATVPRPVPSTPIGALPLPTAISLGVAGRVNVPLAPTVPAFGPVNGHPTAVPYKPAVPHKPAVPLPTIAIPPNAPPTVAMPPGAPAPVPTATSGPIKVSRVAPSPTPTSLSTVTPVAPPTFGPAFSVPATPTPTLTAAVAVPAPTVTSTPPVP